MSSVDHRTGAQSAKRAAVEASVIEATVALLDEGASFGDLGVERIATRAGISRPAFYFYFRDKRDLLMRLTSGVAEVLLVAADGWWSGEGDSADELAQALARFVDMYRRRATLLRAIVEGAATDADVARYWRELVGRFVAATRTRIEQEQATGAIDPALPAHATAFSLCWMIERTAYEHLVQDGHAEDAAIVNAMLAIWMRTLYGRTR